MSCTPLSILPIAPPLPSSGPSPDLVSELLALPTEELAAELAERGAPTRGSRQQLAARLAALMDAEVRQQVAR